MAARAPSHARRTTAWPGGLLQSTEEGERQAAVTSRGRRRLTGAGHRKLLQSSLKEALQDPLHTFSFDEQKKPSESSEISPEIFVFVLVEDLFSFLFF